MGRYFNSRPCERGDHDAILKIRDYFQFQFTPLREGRRTLNSFNYREWSISIHAPARGATGGAVHGLQVGSHFNSRPCERGDTGFGSDYPGQQFQFTPLREGRLLSIVDFVTPSIFQFTPLREGRLGSGGFQVDVVLISIHAPARGATGLIGALCSTELYFNSRPCERGDPTFSAKFPLLTIFQFTPLREGRQEAASKFLSNVVFQFTPLREGRPGAYPLAASLLTVFQFTPLREGRPESGTCQRGPGPISIHAPARGATGGAVHGLQVGSHFNSRPCERGDSVGFICD